MSEILKYLTRDGLGNDIILDVPIKEYPTVEKEFDCCFCGKHCLQGTPIKKITSSNFTDWSFVGEYVCEECSKMFSLYKFSYIIDPDGIHLLNVRQVREEIQKPQKTPFKFAPPQIVRTAQKHPPMAKIF